MIDGAGTIGVEMGPGGIALADNRRPVRLFKITSGSNPYAASEVWLNESSGATAVTGVYDLTAAQSQLWEVNGNTSVPANAIVEGVPNPAGNGFWFSWQSVGTGAVPDLLESGVWSSHSTSSSSTAVTNSGISLPAGRWLVQAAGNTRIRTTVIGDYFQCTISSGTAVPVWNTVAYPCQVFDTSLQNVGAFFVAAVFNEASAFTASVYTQHFISGSITSSEVLAGRTWAMQVV